MKKICIILWCCLSLVCVSCADDKEPTVGEKINGMCQTYSINSILCYLYDDYAYNEFVDAADVFYISNDLLYIASNGEDYDIVYDLTKLHFYICDAEKGDNHQLRLYFIDESARVEHII